MSNRKQYDEDLAALNRALIEMGQEVADAVENAVQALAAADPDAARRVVEGDRNINAM